MINSTKKSISFNAAIGCILGFLGISILCINKHFYINKGDPIIFICAICIALHIILTDKYTVYHNTFNLTFIQMTTVCILSGIFSYKTTYAHLFKIYPNTIFALIVCSFFASAIAFWAQTYFQKFTTSTKTAIIFAGEPVFGAICAYFYLEEKLGIRGIVGAFLVFLGMIISEIKINHLKK